MFRKLWCFAPAVVLIGCSQSPQPQPAAFQPNQPAQPEAAVVSPVAAVSPTGPATASLPQVASIPAGTSLSVRLADSIDTARNRAGDRFTATLDAPVVAGGRVVIPKGTRFTGRVTNSSPSGRLKGRAVLGVRLDSFQLNGHTYPISTSGVTRVSTAHKKRNLALIGGGSGVGAAIGAIAGGGKGALIGAAAGAAAGTGGAAATGKKNVSLPVETLLRFSLRAPVNL